jgi:predicted AlkP superfamily pyrophosphatase or phosphodiesterase
VLLSFDGVGGERLAKMLEAGELPAGGFRRVAERGLFARRSRPPTPSLTAVAHVTHVTGALPRDTGIVANEMMDPRKPFGTRLSGFDAPIRAETLWQSVRRQGRRVGIIVYPGADGTTPERSGDFGVSWIYFPISSARLETFDARSWSDAAGENRTFSEARSVRIPVGPDASPATLVALDGTDDGRRNYDRLRVESETGPPSEVKPGDWFPIEIPGGPGRRGAWCKLLRLDPDLSRTEIYVGAVNSSAAYPEAFRRDLDAKVGFWPGRPDDRLLGAGSAWPAAYAEQAERLADFLTRATLFAVARADWDLLLVYEPEVDEISHEFLLADPAQPGYSLERAAAFAGRVDGAYALADRALDAIAGSLSPTDALFVTSDHGLVPIRATVYPNELLREAGLLRLDPKGEADPDSVAVAMAGSGVANVFLNPRTAPPGSLDRIERLFAGFRLDGRSPWDRIVRRSRAGSLGLDAPESGDLILLARPGIAVERTAVAGRTSGGPLHFGGHGYRNAFPELDATFLAAGPGIARRRVEEFPSTGIASFVSRVLGLDPPRGASDRATPRRSHP